MGWRGHACLLWPQADAPGCVPHLRGGAPLTPLLTPLLTGMDHEAAPRPRTGLQLHAPVLHQVPGAAAAAAAAAAQWLSSAASACWPLRLLFLGPSLPAILRLPM